MKTEVLFNHNYFYPKYGTQHACPTVIIPMVVISMSSVTKKVKIILVTCITRVFKEIFTLIIRFACFCNCVKHLNSYSSYRAAFVQNV